jgi:hypothetical protein
VCPPEGEDGESLGTAGVDDVEVVGPELGERVGWEDGWDVGRVVGLEVGEPGSCEVGATRGGTCAFPFCHDSAT